MNETVFYLAPAHSWGNPAQFYSFTEEFWPIPIASELILPDPIHPQGILINPPTPKGILTNPTLSWGILPNRICSPRNSVQFHPLLRNSVQDPLFLGEYRPITFFRNSSESSHSWRSSNKSCPLPNEFWPIPPHSRWNTVQSHLLLEEFWPNSPCSPKNSDQSHLLLKEFRSIPPTPAVIILLAHTCVIS